MNNQKRDFIRSTLAPLFVFTGDALVVSASLLSSFWLRYSETSPLFKVGLDLPRSYLSDYFPMLVVGACMLMLTFNYFNLYEVSNILRKWKSYGAIFKGLTFWCMTFLGISLALKFEPPISRLFTLYASVVSLVFLFIWRYVFYYALSKYPNVGLILRDRTIIVGINEKFLDGVKGAISEPLHPLHFLGYIADSKESKSKEPSIKYLGTIDDLENIIKQEEIQVVLLADMDLPTETIARTSALCEKHYAKLKLVPSVFEILISGLKMETIGSIPVMGVDNLTINSPFSRISKRIVDIVGACIGLIIFTPVIIVSAMLIFWESKGNPFFLQNRIGLHHKGFKIAKLRSMKPDISGLDAKHQSTQKDDPRLLKIGRFLRKWNLDETPQFLNVLKGEMSLVGPRPERIYHVDQLSKDIPHYLSRHLAKPGMTGWAQANGLRGKCSLEKRIQFDIYYIENWSILFDFQIMLMTFFKWKEPSS